MLRKNFISFVVMALTLVSVAAKGPPPDKGEDSAGNNLSYPVIWSEGETLSLSGTMLQAELTVPYETNPCGDGAFAYAQKTDGNVWQAENMAFTESRVIVNEIDWGDSLESVDMKVGRPVRVELSLYEQVADLGLTNDEALITTFTGYEMVMLANPSSPDEVQGVCALGTSADDNNGAGIFTYASEWATVYSPHGKILIQKITQDEPVLSWNGTQWIGDVDNPIPGISFAGELNVGGKVIYGLSTGGWKPTAIGDYRITFYLPKDEPANTFFDASTIIRVAAEETEVTVAAEEGGDVGGEAYVDAANNLTYIDVTVVGGGGGGGKKP